jgi:hypothetical protein
MIDVISAWWGVELVGASQSPQGFVADQCKRMCGRIKDVTATCASGQCAKDLWNSSSITLDFC